MAVEEAELDTTLVIVAKDNMVAEMELHKVKPLQQELQTVEAVEAAKEVHGLLQQLGAQE